MVRSSAKVSGLETESRSELVMALRWAHQNHKCQQIAGLMKLISELSRNWFLFRRSLSSLWKHHALIIFGFVQSGIGALALAAGAHSADAGHWIWLLPRPQALPLTRVELHDTVVVHDPHVAVGVHHRGVGLPRGVQLLRRQP